MIGLRFRFSSLALGRFIFIGVILYTPLWAMAQDLPAFSSTDEIRITADRMMFKNKEQKAVFESNVTMKKGDMSLWADHVEVVLAGEGSKEEREASSLGFISGSPLDNNTVSEVRAWGNVRIKQGPKYAEAQEAVYDRADEKVTLEGEPILSEDGYRIAGSKMTLFLRENRSVVENSRVLIQPEKAKEGRANLP